MRFPETLINFFYWESIANDGECVHANFLPYIAVCLVIFGTPVQKHDEAPRPQKVGSQLASRSRCAWQGGQGDGYTPRVRAAQRVAHQPPSRRGIRKY